VRALPPLLGRPSLTRSLFVTGGPGLFGSALCCELARRGYCARREGPATRVRALARRAPPAGAGAPNVEWRTGDLLEPGSLAGALDGVDVVIHCAGAMPADARACDAIVRGATQLLLDLALRAGVRRFVLVSSVAVYGDAEQRRTAESAPRVAANGYAAARIAAEDLVLAAAAGGAIEATIVRPCPIVGAGHLVRGALELMMQPRVPLPDGGRAPLSLVAAEDAAAALARAGLDDERHDGAFNVAAEEALSLRELLETVAAAAPARGRAEFEELPCAEALARNEAAARRGEPPPVHPALVALSKEHTFASRRARAELGFTERAPLRAALAGAVAACLA